MSVGQKVTRTIDDLWRFTQIGGENRNVVKDGEWLETTEFPTTVHVELLKAKRIPNPVRVLFVSSVHPNIDTTVNSSLDCTNGMYNVCPTVLPR